MRTMGDLGRVTTTYKKQRMLNICISLVLSIMLIYYFTAGSEVKEETI